jgi:hypothetical protein
MRDGTTLDRPKDWQQRCQQEIALRGRVNDQILIKLKNTTVIALYHPICAFRNVLCPCSVLLHCIDSLATRQQQISYLEKKDLSHNSFEFLWIPCAHRNLRLLDGGFAKPFNAHCFTVFIISQEFRL